MWSISAIFGHICMILCLWLFDSVGAGSSGCVIANRLSQDAGNTVLILEAGGDDRSYPDISIPGRCGNLGNTGCDWGFRLVPEENAFKGYEGRVSSRSLYMVVGISTCIPRNDIPLALELTFFNQYRSVNIQENAGTTSQQLPTVPLKKLKNGYSKNYAKLLFFNLSLD